MKVTLIGGLAKDGQKSMGLYVDALAFGLRARGVEVNVLRPRSVFSRFSNRRGRAYKWLSYADRMILFPPKLAASLRGAADGGAPSVVHICDQANAYYARQTRPLPTVVTCHDLIAIMAAAGKFDAIRVRRTGRCYQAIIKAALRRAPAIVCVSNRTQRDLVATTGCGIEKTAVIYNQLAYPYRALGDNELNLELGRMALAPDQPYILHVGSDQWYKNRPGVIRAFARLQEQSGWPGTLLLVGPKLGPKESAIAAQAGITRRIHCLEGASNSNLNALYGRAVLLLFPSIYEGFGWPAVEAQASGCPVVASTGGALPEVLGQSALLAEPDDEQALAALAAGLLANPARRQEIIVRGLDNARRFAAPTMVEGYLEYYRRFADPAGRFR